MLERIGKNVIMKVSNRFQYFDIENHDKKQIHNNNSLQNKFVAVLTGLDRNLSK